MGLLNVLQQNPRIAEEKLKSIDNAKKGFISSIITSIMDPNVDLSPLETIGKKSSRKKKPEKKTKASEQWKDSLEKTKDMNKATNPKRGRLHQ